MTSAELRELFLEFFRKKEHEIVHSAPMVVKNDPSLMFTNAGMNQFKDIFLGINKPVAARVANSQKCLRVSGKHNDLEEVGHDTYHHTMFEMLGNWSFGDYFKEEAISWAFEFLTRVMKIPVSQLYATVFEGNPEENLEMDHEALACWRKFLPDDQILTGSKKDNFWEMGETGPCGPCSEIHVDIRPAVERKRIAGRDLVNKGHSLVIEIWNLVFIQYNRKADGSLEQLPQKHVDTGMGFERLCMVAQGKLSNYDTDIFTPIIREIAYLTGIRYGAGEDTDVAMRVIADHLRAVSFSIADGQLPSNTGAGYVIRRILRRAIRYNFTFLDQTEAIIHRLLPALTGVLGSAFPELESQKKLIRQVIKEEETSFLRTLDTGIRLIDQISAREKDKKILPGKLAFELYDTYGFPIDLTELILKEKGMTVDMEGFRKELKAQKERSRNAAAVETDDWVEVHPGNGTFFLGYDSLSTECKILRYRKVSSRKGAFFHLVLDRTPFYAEAGGQVGDAGMLTSGEEKIPVLDTRHENNQIIHISNVLPSRPDSTFRATVDTSNRLSTACNHTATHLLHHALRIVLGNHVEQKGSLVHPEYLRFDFSHFQKLTEEETAEVERRVNELIRENHSLVENRELAFADARKMGAISLFGEKYGNVVRVIRFGDSIELCGGTHVPATGNIGVFKITSESAIAAGIRRIEAITARHAQEYINGKLASLEKIQQLLKQPGNPVAGLERLIAENTAMAKKLEEHEKNMLESLRKQLLQDAEHSGGAQLVISLVRVSAADQLRDLCFRMKPEHENLYIALGAEIEGKAHLALMISDRLVKERGLNASRIIREISPEIRGGGGGQPFFATAGGKDPSGLQKALERARSYME